MALQNEENQNDALINKEVVQTVKTDAENESMIVDKVNNMNLNGNNGSDSLVETNNNLNLTNGKNRKNPEMIINTENLPVNEYQESNANDSM